MELNCQSSVRVDLFFFFSIKYQMIKIMGFVYLMPCNIPIKAQICFYVLHMSYFFLPNIILGAVAEISHQKISHDLIDLNCEFVRHVSRYHDRVQRPCVFKL